MNMQLMDAITMAIIHAIHSKDSSADLCVRDAIRLMDSGDDDNAWLRTLDSLAYSVGVFNVDFKRVRDASPIVRRFAA